MGAITIPDLSPKAEEALRARAARQGRTVEQELRDLVERTYAGPQPKSMDEVRRRLRALKGGGKLPDSSVDAFLEERRREADDR